MNVIFWILVVVIAIAIVVYLVVGRKAKPKASQGDTSEEVGGVELPAEEPAEEPTKESSNESPEGDSEV